MSQLAPLDVKSLYPSIPHAEGAREVAEFIERSDTVDIENFDIRSAQVFITSNLSTKQIKYQGLVRLIPTRKHARGPRSGNTTEELWKSIFPRCNNSSNNTDSNINNIPPQHHDTTHNSTQHNETTGTESNTTNNTT